MCAKPPVDFSNFCLTEENERKYSAATVVGSSPPPYGSSAPTADEVATSESREERNLMMFHDETEIC